jgi:hypothetical protein
MANFDSFVSVRHQIVELSSRKIRRRTSVFLYSRLVISYQLQGAIVLQLIITAKGFQRFGRAERQGDGVCVCSQPEK